MNELSADYIKARELDRRIKTSAQLAQQSLYDMCMGFKEMRDSKLYKELGYGNFEDYCEKETQINRQNVYKYIKVAENLPSEFVSSGRQIGIKKLYLLSTLSEDDRTTLTESTDLESTTVCKLEEKIKQLKDENAKNAESSQCMIKSLQARLDDTGNAMRSAAQEAKQYKERITELESEIKELESRPVEVAVEQSDSERRLQETIRSLERENIKRNEELEAQYREDEQRVRSMLEQEKQEALAEKEQKLSALRAELESTKVEYEKRLAEKTQPAPADESKVKFKILLSAAYDSLMRAAEFAKSNEEFKGKIRQLTASVDKILEV